MRWCTQSWQLCFFMCDHQVRMCDRLARVDFVRVLENNHQPEDDSRFSQVSLNLQRVVHRPTVAYNGIDFDDAEWVSRKNIFMTICACCCWYWWLGWTGELSCQLYHTKQVQNEEMLQHMTVLWFPHIYQWWYDIAKNNGLCSNSDSSLTSEMTLMT